MYLAEQFKDHQNEKEYKYSLEIKVYKNLDEEKIEKVLEGSCGFEYKSKANSAVHSIVVIFEKLFGYIVDYSFITDSENDRFLLEVYLKEKTEEPEIPDEGEEKPIDPPENGTEEPENPEESGDATDENSHILQSL